GALFNFESKNNIWHNWWTARPSIGANCSATNCVSDYDIYTGQILSAGRGQDPGQPAEFHGVATTPTYASGTSAFPDYPDQSAQPGNFSLKAGTRGIGEGTRINNFNDQYASVDIGAH